MKRNILIPPVLLLTSLCSCVTGQSGWHWKHSKNPGPAQLSRDLYDCQYYASITDSRAIGSEWPIMVQEWDEPVQECMLKRGWVFVDPHAKVQPSAPVPGRE